MKLKSKLAKTVLAIIVAMFAAMFAVGAGSTAFAAAGDVPPHAKKLTNNGDGTYTISLDVTGESEKKPNPVNVIVILDYSRSMSTNAGGGQTRMQAAKNAVNNLARSLFTYNNDEYPNLVQMALVGFSTHGDITQSPTNNYNTFSGAVNRLNPDGGTNWEDALADAANVDFGDKDPTYVIFVSDGNPTFRNTRGNYNPLDNYWYNQYGVYGNGNDQSSYQGIPVATTIGRCYDHAVDDAQALASSVGADHFYTIGAYGDVSRMQSLTTDAGAPGSNYFSASNTSELESALETILAEIEKAGIGSVEVEDGTTNKVTTSSGVAELLEVDTDSFKYYRDGVEWTSDPTPPEASLNSDGEVVWDLSSIGVLDDGVKYTVTFDCYPSQTTYDYIAQLKNGDIQYSDLDPEVQKYIVKTGENDYSLRTNTKATLDYDDTRTEGDEDEVEYTNPEPQPTDAETLSVEKEWEGADPDVNSLKLTVLMDGKKFHEAELSKSNSWKDSSFISIGIMKNGKVLKGAEGHDFTFAELDDTQYHWELDAPTVHPMLIDGALTMLVKVDEKHPAQGTTYTIGEDTYYADSSVAGLKATNHRRSNLNLTKKVEGDDVPKDAEFPFTLTVKNSKAPESEPEDDPQHNSDYWVWFSIYDTNASETVMDATVSGAEGPNSSGYYYAKSGTAITVNMKDGWNLRFTNLPTETTYEFVEGTLPAGFNFSKSELTQGTDSTFKDGQTTTGTIEETKTSYYVTYTNKYALTKVKVTKIWEDYSDRDGFRPDDLELTLTADPEVSDIPDPEIKKDGNKWTYTWEDLPKYDEDGTTEIKYTVSEDEVPDYYKCSGSPAENGGEITNTYKPSSVIVDPPVQKIIENNDDLYNKGDFTFKIEAVSPSNAPMPKNTSIKNTSTYEKEGKTGYYEFGEIEFTAPGTYEYKVTESGNAPGVTNDPDATKGKTLSFEVTVEKSDDPDNPAKLVVTPETDDVELSFTNTYKAKGDTKFNVKKELKGRTLKEGQFKFELLDEDGKVIETAKNDADGNVNFKKIEYTEKDLADEEEAEESSDDNSSSSSAEPTTQAADDDSDDEGVDEEAADEGAADEEAADEGAAEGEATDEGAAEGEATDEGAADEEATDEGAAEGEATDEEANDEAAEEEAAPAIKLIEFASAAEDDVAEMFADEPSEAAEEAADEAAEGEAAEGEAAADEAADEDAADEAADEAAGAEEEAAADEAADEADEPKLTTASAGDNKTFTYTIREVNDGKAGYEYDDHEVTVKVKVTDDGEGNLKTDVTYDGDRTFTNKYKAEGSISFSGKKKLKGADLEEGQFRFKLKGPDGKAIQTVSNDADGNFSFKEISYDQGDAGKTFSYQIVEVKGDETGVTYDTHVCSIKVKVTDNGDGTLDVNATYKGDTTFVNKFKSEPVKVKLEGTKTLVGKDLKSGEFKFELTNEDGDVVKKATNDADGNINFGTYTFKEEGTYTYTATEVKGSDKNMTYDTADHVFTIEVTEEDGELVAEVECDGGETADFQNTYEKKKTPPKKVIPPTKILPPTGDTLPIMLLLAIAIAAAAAVVIAARRFTLAKSVETKGSHARTTKDIHKRTRG